jgi:glycosyltransferase involved in cell wall biosynthesis
VKVLFATMQFGPGYGQGTERYVSMLATGLAARGHAAVIVAGDPLRRRPAAQPGDEIADSPRTLHVATSGVTCVHGPDPAQWAALLAQERPDVVHVANPAQIGVGVVAAARERGVPVVTTIMDYWWLCPKHTLLHHRGHICDARVPWRECLHCLAASDARAWVRGVARVPGLRSAALPTLYFGRALLRGESPAELKRWTDRQRHLVGALNAAAGVIFPSAGTRDAIAPRLDHTRTHPIPYGLEPRWFEAARQRPRREPPTDPAELVIGFAGALEPHKGPHLVVEALRRLGWARTRLVLAGGGAAPRYEAELRARAAGLNAEFAGRVPTDEMPALLASCDLLIMPSLWPENLPIVVLEGLAAGVPVMSSRIAGVNEVITDPGMLFDVGSAEDLAARLAAWAQAPIGVPDPPPVSTAEEMIDRTLGVYASVVGGPASEP